ncbi:PH domain-containing protein [Streptomyces sp. PTD5-9]|uniref:PH domain-containing protein n=1 Tax=Streptomyces sp. PTD5-9 TaxID=3120150 RepID=UPI003008486E
MSDVQDVVCRPPQQRALWVLVGLGALGVILTAGHAWYRGPSPWLGVGALSLLVCGVALRVVTSEAIADAYGVRSRSLLRRRSVPWSEVAELRVRRRHASRRHETCRVVLVLRDGHKRLLPLPQSTWYGDPDFAATVEALRALHRRHGEPRSDHLPVVSAHTAGRGWAGSLAACVVLLGVAGAVLWAVPGTASDARAWRAAEPCTATTPAAQRSACLSTTTAVIERVAKGPGRKIGRLYFADDRPSARLEMSREDAAAFEPGERVELTLWRGRVTQVAGERHVWREHLPDAGDLTALAAGCLLTAGFPAAQLLLRLRGRALPDDDVLPSALPFAAPLGVTALWLLPLCCLHPVSPFESASTIGWAAAGALVSLALFAWAWRATRLRTPDVTGGTGSAGSAGSAGSEGGVHGTEGAAASGDEEVFVAARFLDETDYNPHGFGTHIVLGGDSPAVTPHSGPGRFAAIRIPVERLTLRGVRRVRGGDGDTVSRSWHVAELDDAGTPVRLAAAPDDLARVIRALRAVP